MDVLDSASMKAAAKCINQYDTQTSKNHKVVERQWRPFSLEFGHVRLSVKNVYASYSFRVRVCEWLTSAIYVSLSYLFGVLANHIERTIGIGISSEQCF